MRVFVYDLEYPGRDWDSLLNPYAPMAWNPTADTTVPGDLLICHWRFVSAITDAAVKAAARGVAVLFVSGGRLSGRVENGVYHRRAIVDNPTDP